MSTNILAIVDLSPLSGWLPFEVVPMAQSLQSPIPSLVEPQVGLQHDLKLVGDESTEGRASTRGEDLGFPRGLRVDPNRDVGHRLSCTTQTVQHTMHSSFQVVQRSGRILRGRTSGPLVRPGRVRTSTRADLHLGTAVVGRPVQAVEHPLHREAVLARGDGWFVVEAVVDEAHHLAGEHAVERCVGQPAG